MAAASSNLSFQTARLGQHRRHAPIRGRDFTETTTGVDGTHAGVVDPQAADVNGDLIREGKRIAVARVLRLQGVGMGRHGVWK